MTTKYNLLEAAINLNVLTQIELDSMFEMTEDELLEDMDFSFNYNTKIELIILSIMNTAWINRMNEGSPFQDVGAYSKLCVLNDNISKS